MAWLILVFAGLLEVVWAFGLKKYGLSWSIGSALTVSLVIFSFWLLHVAMRTLPLGVAYPVWTGIGAIGSALVGMIVLNESRDVVRVVCIVMIVAGIVGLKAFTPPEATPPPASTEVVATAATPTSEPGEPVDQ